MKKNYLVSIIVPVYNTEKYVGRCLESIISQTYPNIEIIVIDDGSIDKSYDICASYQKKYKNIKVIHKINEGVSSARNIGLENCNGDYVGFVDSDDYIDKNMVEVMMSEINKHNLDIAICNLYFENENLVEIKKSNHFDYFIKRCEYPFEMYYNLSVQGYVCNKIYKKDLIKKNMVFFDDKCCILEDDLFNFKVFTSNSHLNIKYIDKKFYHYIQLNNGASKSKFNLKKLSYFYVREEEIKILEKENIAIDYLMVDYIITYKRMKFLAKRYGFYSNDIFDSLEKKYNLYQKEVKLVNIHKMLLIKYCIVKYLPFIYYLKILFED